MKNLLSIKGAFRKSSNYLWALPVAVGVLMLTPTISAAVVGPSDVLTPKMPVEYRIYKIAQAIDEYVQGSQVYKNYLLADIANEAVHLDVSDLYGVEWNLLKYNKSGKSADGFGSANVGIGQIGPSTDPDSFVNKWLNEKGWDGYDLLEDDIKNMLAVDAYVTDYVVGVLLKERNPEVYYRYSCVLTPRNCDNLWTDYEATRTIAAYRNGNLSNTEHGKRIADWAVNAKVKAVSEVLGKDEELVVDGVSVSFGKPELQTRVAEADDSGMSSYNIIKENYICATAQVYDARYNPSSVQAVSLVLRIGEEGYYQVDGSKLPQFGPFTLGNQQEYCFYVPDFFGVGKDKNISLEVVYGYREGLLPMVEGYLLELGKLSEVESEADLV